MDVKQEIKHNLYPLVPCHIYVFIENNYDLIYSCSIKSNTSAYMDIEDEVSEDDGGLEFQVTWPRWPPCWYMEKKYSEIFFSWTRSPMSLKLGMHHRGLKPYKVYINDGPGLTLAYITARSNLVVYMFEWGKLLQSI